MRGRASESGYSLVALVAAVTVMMIFMGAALPGWKYVMKNEREEELIFRGSQIADAVAAFQKKNGNALPPSLEVLVKGKFLRKAYKDPMTPDGKWRFLAPGQGLPAGPGQPVPGAGLPPGAPPPGPGGGLGSPSTTPGEPGKEGGQEAQTALGQTAGLGAASGGGTSGPFAGVASRSRERSLRVVNGRSKYNEWFFLPGQPIVVGKPMNAAGAPGGPGGVPGGPGAPAGVPTPLPAAPGGAR